MSQRMTTIRPRVATEGKRGIGFTDYGERTREEMIARMRRHYEHQLEQAQRALAMSDDEFVVESHAGIYVRREVKEVS